MTARLRVVDWMSADPVVVLHDAPLETAARLMVHHRYRHLPAIDAEGRLVGLLDDADVFARGEWTDRWRPHDDRDGSLRVNDCAREARIVVQGGDPLQEALHPLATEDECAVVVDGGRRPVGILTAHDAVRHAPTVIPASLTTRELGKRVVVTVSPGQTVGTVLDTMRAHRVRHVVVVADQRPTAVVSWRNLVELEAGRRRSLHLDALGSPAPQTVHDGTRLDEICEHLVTQKIGCLPVVDGDGRLVGIVSRTDLVAAVLRHLAA